MSYGATDLVTEVLNDVHNLFLMEIPLHDGQHTLSFQPKFSQFFSNECYISRRKKTTWRFIRKFDFFDPIQNAPFQRIARTYSQPI